MGFHAVALPSNLSYGTSGGPAFRTTIVQSQGGREQRFANWSNPRRKYSAQITNEDPATVQEWLTFFIAREGALNGFLFYDYTDHSTASDGVGTPDDEDVVIGTGDGTETQFQLVKKYTDSAATKTRTITKPIESTLVVAVNGVNTTAFTVDTSTGIITMNSAPTSGHDVTAGFEFYVPVRFDDSLDEDGLRALYQSYDNIDIVNIDMIELLGDELSGDDRYMGGSITISTNADRDITLSDGFFQMIDNVVAGLTHTLPDPASLVSGGPHVVLANVGTYNCTLKDHNGNTLLTLLANGVAECYVVTDDTPSQQWLVLS